MSEPAVLILLSSYNGARYIADQIDSIRAQTIHDWRLLVRDDGSADNTRSILRTFTALDDRIAMLGDNRGNVGPWASFGLLLSAAAKTDAHYLFLSDQDDVWLPTKMAGQLDASRRAEKAHGTAHAILTHSDLEVVGDKLEPIHPSYREFQNLSHDLDDPLRTLLVHNGMVGCTIAMNRALLNFALPIPAWSAHDWWLGLCAAATGTIVTSDERTVRYRQHASNVIGARPSRAFVSRAFRHPIGFIAESLAAFDVGVRQSVELSERMAQRTLGSPETQRRVRRYAQAFSPQPLPSRVRSLREIGRETTTASLAAATPWDYQHPSPLESDAHVMIPLSSNQC